MIRKRRWRDLRRGPTAADKQTRRIQDRYLAWRTLEPSDPPHWPPPTTPVFGEGVDIPDIQATELTSDVLADGLLNHGALVVRGLMSTGFADELRADLDQVFEVMSGLDDGRPVDPDDGGRAAFFRLLKDPLTGETVHSTGRSVVKSTFAGACGAADSPYVGSKLLDFFADSGLVSLISGYLGECPALSLEKWTLRRVPPTTSTSWHQDGAFLGETVRTVNVWIALSDCGIDASGLDIVPRRFDRIVEHGTRGAYFAWDVGSDVVDEERGDAEILSPEFAPGDAVIFDQYLLHRTGHRDGMTKDRYAIESWFFAPSKFPERYHGILL